MPFTTKWLANFNQLKDYLQLQRRSPIMDLWKNRTGYTNSNVWPVVPFRLTKYEEELYTVNYKIGLDKNLVLGWSVGLCESLYPHHPVMVWEKESMSLQRDIVNDGGCLKYISLETMYYYDLLSPICNSFRKHYDFLSYCRNQCNNVIDKIFQLLDQLVLEDKDIFSLHDYYSIYNTGSHFSDDRLLLRVFKRNGSIYFEYVCPLTNMTEIIFPVICGGITIALVVIGQIVEDLELVKRKVMQIAHDYNNELRDIMMGNYCIDNKESIISITFNHISVLEDLYRQQVDSERREIMNTTFDILTNKILTISFNNDDSIKNIIKMIADKLREAKNYLIERMGLEEMFIYLDKYSLKPVVNKNSSVLKKLKCDTDNDNNMSYKCFHNLDDVGDLFLEDGAPLISDNERPKLTLIDNEVKDIWSIFVLSSTPEDEPIVLGIKYKSDMGFLSFIEENRLLFERNLLPKFAMLIQNTLLRLEAHKRALVLEDNRRRLSHEVGQIAAGIRALNKSFSHKTFETKMRLQELDRRFGNDSALKEAYQSFLKKAELYAKDIEGQFEIVEMMSKVYSDDIVVKPIAFDLWTEFFHRWRLIFYSQCSANNHFLNMPFEQIDSRKRIIYTDPFLLQCALYNVMSNAIKYSYVNTNINVEYNNTNPEIFKFTISNFGSYLNPYDRSIYERGVRSHSNMGVAGFDNESVIRGEGLGLYWSELLINKLGGKIYHTCDKLCNYNISLIEPFIKRYYDNSIFLKFWVNAKDTGLIDSEDPELSYSNIKTEYEKLITHEENSISEYNRVVNNWSDNRLNSISFFKLYTDINLPTYKISFVIEIPNRKGV